MCKAVFKRGHAKIIYMIKGWNRFKASKDFLEWFGELAGDRIIVKVPQSEAFVQAGVEGKSVVKIVPKEKPRKQRLRW